MIWSVDPESFGLLTFNHGLSDYFLQQRGIRIQIGMRPEDLFPTEDFIKRWHGFYHRALSEGPYTTEYLVYAGSSILQLTLNLLERDGKVFGISVFGKDITERKQAEEALAQERNLLRTLMDNLPDKVYIKDAEGRYVINNPVHLRSLGVTQQDTLGKTCFEFFPQPLAEQFNADEQEIIRSGQPLIEKEEVVVDLPTGQPAWHLTTKVPLRDSQGKVVGLLGVSRDITERKRAEEVLQRKQDMLARTESIAQVGSWEWDVATDTVTWSDELFRLFQRNPADGAPSFAEHPELYYPEDLQRLREAVEAAVSNGAPYEMELRAIRKDGATRVCLARGHAEMGPEKRATRLFGSLQDITERKRAEEALRRAEEKYRSIFENAVEGIYQSTPEGRFTTANPALARMWGYESPQELIASITDIARQVYIDPDRRAQVRRALEEQDEVRQVEFQTRKKDGSTMWVSENARAVRDTNGACAYEGTFEDITKRKQAEAALRESEARFRKILEMVPLPLCYVDKDGVITFRNERFVQVFGYTADDVPTLAEWWSQAYPDAQYRQWVTETWDAAVKRAAEEGRDIDPIEYKVTCKSGKERIIEISGITLGDNFLATFIDLTKRKQAEDELRESEDRFRRVSAMTSDIAYSCRTKEDGRFSIEWMTGAADRITGYSGEEIKAQGCWRFLVVGEDLALFEENVIGLAPGSQGSCELRIRHKNGGIVWIASFAECVSEPQTPGRLLLYGGLVDITERKQAEAYRAMGRQVLQILNEPGDMRDAIQRVLAALKTQSGFDAVGIRLQDGDDFPYYVQEGFSKDFLLTENTLVERAADGGVCRDKDGNISLECTCGLVISGKTDPTNPYFTQGGSCWTNDKAGAPFQDTRLHPRDRCTHDGFQSVVLAPIRNEDRIVGLIQLNDRRKGRLTLDTVELMEGIASYIGAALMRKRAEEALRELNAVLEQRVAERTQELSLANLDLARAVRLRDEFLANMSHELHTPLNGILGLSEALQEGVYGPLTPQQMHSLQTIHSSGQRLFALVSNVLDYAKIGAGKLDVQMGPVSVKGVCQTSLRSVEQAAQAKRITLTSQLDEQVESLQADHWRLKQILVNLLANAVKFTPEGGAVGLEVTASHSPEGGREARFTVWDTGIGITPEDIGRLFQPFTQLDTGLARRYEGAGLGLALVARLVELHGGRVWVESELGHGSRFIVAIPWQAAGQETRASGHAQVDQE
jgi:PAS domain S-box-containing protein